MIAVFSGGNKLSSARGFIIMQSGEGLTSFDKHSSAYFSSEKKVYNEAFRSVYFLEYAKTTLGQISFCVDATTQRRMKHARFTKSPAPLIMIETH